MAKKKTFNFGKLKLFVLIGVLIYVCVTFVNQQSLLTSQLARQSELLEKEEALERDIEYYKNELDYIGTDEYVEQEARTRFGWLKPGETKYVEGTVSAEPTVEPTPDPTEQPEATASSPEENATASLAPSVEILPAATSAPPPEETAAP